MPLLTSQAGCELIHSFEALRLQAYTDVGCYPTIGWGHLITLAECASFEIDPAIYDIVAMFKVAAKAGDKKGMSEARSQAKLMVAKARKISRVEADALFEKDLSRTERGMLKALKVSLNRHQWDALASWTYNLGAGTLQASRLLKLLNAGRYSDVPEQMLRFRFANGIYSEGLENRRRIEAACWKGQLASVAYQSSVVGVSVDDTPTIEIKTKPVVTDTTLPQMRAKVLKQMELGLEWMTVSLFDLLRRHSTSSKR